MNMRCSGYIGGLAASVILLTSCTPQEPPPEIAISPNPIPAAPPSDAKEQLIRLEKIIGERKARREAVQDVIAILAAQDHESKEEWDLAVQSWLEAVKKAEGRFGRKAFEGWAKAYGKILGQKADPKEMARVLLSVTKNGQQSQYLMARGLFRPQQLELELTEIVGKLPTDEEVVAVQVPEKGIPADDPLLTRTVRGFCKNPNAHKDSWKTWTSSLSKVELDFWRAKVAVCQKESDRAIHLFKNIIASLSNDPKTATWGVHAAENLVALYRAEGERELAANAYIILMKAFEKPGVQAEDYGESKIAFALRRIDATLWAARYRAMVGDFQNGKNFVQEAFDQIAKVHVDHPQLHTRNRDQLAEMKAEGYHILAFRIALEQKDFTSALAFNRLGLQIMNLRTDWKNRFNWFSGLYEYLSGNHQEAIKRWESMLAEINDEKLKPQLYFWLARSYALLKQDVKSEYYLQTLYENHPLHFYSIVGPKLANFPDTDRLEKMFGSAREIGDNLLKAKDYDLARFRRHKKVGPLLFRAELLVAANAGEWQTLAVRELSSETRKNFRVKSHHDAYVYLSRLLYQGGEYNQAISLTSELSGLVESFWEKYQEQLFISFPRPYADIVERYATKYYLDREILYSIGKQESQFNPLAKSPAGAFGIMQLIPPTAERFAQEEKVELSRPEERLLEPEVNIRLGSAYLRFLHRHYKGELASVAGAYNAGEYVVDSWLERRANEDLLMWIELIPFGETKDYVKNVVRNHHVYKFVSNTITKIAQQQKKEENQSTE